MDGPIQNVFPNILNGWPHTECFTKHTKWMAPYRMFLNAKWMAPYRMFSQNGWPHTECFSTHTKWMAPYRMLIITC